MRLRNVKNANEIVKASPYVISTPSDFKGKYRTVFKNKDNEIHLEIGTGKGDFIIGMAKMYPNINFISVELYESVMVRAVQKLDNENLDNLKLINIDALGLDTVFDHEISTIYLNFSDPWPKSRHEKRRLTSNRFLDIYDKISANKTHIIQKTDNIGLFAYSLSNLSKNGYVLKRVSLDLENEDIPNVETEYERKFKEKGYKINYLEAVKCYEKWLNL